MKKLLILILFFPALSYCQHKVVIKGGGYTTHQVDSIGGIKAAYVAGIPALRNYTGNSNTVIVQDSLRGGIFRYISVGTPDSMTVFSKQGGGYWVRQFSGNYHLWWAGVDPTGVTDNTAIINYELQTGLPVGATLFVDAGQYKDTGLVMTRAINIIGAGMVSSSFLCTNPNSAGITIGANCNNFTIRDLAIVGNGTTGFATDATNGNGIAFIMGSGISAGIDFDNVLFYHNGGYSVFSDSTGLINNIYFTNCLFQDNHKAAVHMIAQNGQNQINAVNFKKCTFSNIFGNGAEVWGVNFNFNENTFEQCTQRGIVLNNDFIKASGYGVSGVAIKDNYFEGCDSGFILLRSTGVGGLIRGVTISNNYGFYDTIPASSIVLPHINYAGINLAEVQATNFTTYPASPIQGFQFLSNYFYTGVAGYPNSVLNGNNVLSYSATVQPDRNDTITYYKNLGQAMLLYGNTYGKVTTMSVVANNGITQSVATPTTTPVLTLGLGAITPTNVNSTGVLDNLYNGNITISDSIAGGALIHLKNTTVGTGNDWILNSLTAGGFAIGKYGAANYLTSDGTGNFTFTFPLVASSTFQSDKYTMKTSTGTAGGLNAFGLVSSTSSNLLTTTLEGLDLGPSLGFGTTNKWNGSSFLYGVIRGAKESTTATNDYAGYLAFYTLNAGSATAERMRITSTGNVGIGTSSTSHLLEVAGTGNFTGALTVTAPALGDSSTTAISSGWYKRDSILASHIKGVIDTSHLAKTTLKLGPDLASNTAGDSIFLKKRVYQVATESTSTYNTDTTRLYVITGLATNATFANPTGATPNDGTEIEIRMTDNGASHTISWGTAWRGSNVVPLPTGSVPSTPMDYKFRYNAIDAKYDIITPTNTVLSGSYSGTGTATTAFVVTFGGTEANTNYVVNVTPTNALSAANLYVVTKTTTSFTVTYLAGLTGAVAFDWSLFRKP